MESSSIAYSEEILKLATSRVALGRMAQPSEIAGMAVFLASDASSFITGVTVLADGGAMLS